jgi:hypothetical protein
MGYDIIGDVHGCADALEALLRKLGYVRERGAWRHAGRTAIFVGDFVDRGDQQVEVLEIARGMIDAGSARAVLGNHEYNAIAYATERPDHVPEYDETLPGHRWLRPHSKKNEGQHAKFLAQVGEGSERHQRWVEWFRTLPVFLELDGVRIVHACWDAAAVERLRGGLEADGTLGEAFFFETHSRGTQAFEDIETVVKGKEMGLLGGLTFQDADGITRDRIRLKWWATRGAQTYRSVAHGRPEVVRNIPDEPLPAGMIDPPDESVPTFFGHYWLSGTPAAMTRRLACVDYSAVRGHLLCAYRWDGEPDLDDAHFVAVGAGRGEVDA